MIDDAQEMILVLDFGGQYSQLIARRIREANVFSKLVPFDISLEDIKDLDPDGIVLSGGPSSVYEKGFLSVNEDLFDLGVPILGICYGMQLMGGLLPGGEVESAEKREYGSAVMEIDNRMSLFDGVDQKTECWMSHGDRVVEVPEGFKVMGHTSNSPIAAMGNPVLDLYGVQFHPEVTHTARGQDILENFLFKICGCSGDWTTSNFIENKIREIREEVGESKVICGLSGGVDSSVAAKLVHEAIGDQLTSIFVDHGLLRKNEPEEVRETFGKKFDMDLDYVDARDRFFNKLKGIKDPEKKRKIIGEEFIRVFEEEANKIGDAKYLVQGTIYSDVIESGGTDQASVIKSHHNVGGLPEEIGLDIIEPLRSIFKDEVREVGEKLGLPDSIVWRQPFPGPGLGIRVLGEVTRKKVKIVREADAILRKEIKESGLDNEIWQYFAALPPMRSVGVMGDQRTYSYTVGIRAVKSKDAMTADWAKIPHEVLDRISTKITNEVDHVNRVVYDITSKPPATIEWE